MKPAIEQKLGTFLDVHMPPAEECHVVYLLVEARKLLDYEGTGPYRLMRFYADWAVHTQKDRITSEMKSMMNEIKEELHRLESDPESIAQPSKLMPFISMRALQSEIADFLRGRSISDALVMEKNWISFRTLLAGVLADQPILTPCDGVLKFCFKPAPQGQISGEVLYKNKVGEVKTISFFEK